MSKPRVIVTRRWPQEVEARLAEQFAVELNREDRPLDRHALKAAFSAADAVFPTVTDAIDAEVLSAEPLRARLIGNFGVGFNNIDVEAAKARGIVVTNTPGVLTETTADFAFALLMRPPTSRWRSCSASRGAWARASGTCATAPGPAGARPT